MVATLLNDLQQGRPAMLTILAKYMLQNRELYLSINLQISRFLKAMLVIVFDLFVGHTCNTLR
jgi:hypothetical protein